MSLSLSKKESISPTAPGNMLSYGEFVMTSPTHNFPFETILKLPSLMHGNSTMVQPANEMDVTADVLMQTTKLEWISKT